MTDEGTTLRRILEGPKNYTEGDKRVWLNNIGEELALSNREDIKAIASSVLKLWELSDPANPDPSQERSDLVLGHSLRVQALTILAAINLSHEFCSSLDSQEETWREDPESSMVETLRNLVRESIGHMTSAYHALRTGRIADYEQARLHLVDVGVVNDRLLRVTYKIARERGIELKPLF